MKNIYKKACALVGASAASLATFAEESSGSTTSGIVSVSDVTEIFSNAQTSMTSLVDAALPVIIAFVGGGLIIWGALALISLLKRGFGAGKGR